MSAGRNHRYHPAVRHRIRPGGAASPARRAVAASPPRGTAQAGRSDPGADTGGVLRRYRRLEGAGHLPGEAGLVSGRRRTDFLMSFVAPALTECALIAIK